MGKRIILIILFVLFLLNTVSASKGENPVDIYVEISGECEEASIEEGYTLVINYRWMNAEINNGYESKIKVSSEEIDFQQNEYLKENLYQENNPEGKLEILITEDMLLKDSGKIHFEIYEKSEDYSCGKEELLYFAVDGNRICLSEEEQHVENYFQNKEDNKVLLVIGVVVLFVLLLYLGCALTKNIRSMNTLKK